MRIGVPKEIKNHEYRVGLTPAAVRQLAEAGHQLLVQSGAGTAIGYPDQDYVEAGAQICASASALYSDAELVIKVKEPQPAEIELLQPGQILFGYFHLAPEPELARRLLQADVICIAYETVTDDQGRLPLLAPMSEIAGRLATQVGAHYMEIPSGGRGVLPGGTSRVPGARICVLGGGVVGENAAVVALGMGADVVVLERSTKRLDQLEHAYPGLHCLESTPDSIAKWIPLSDLVIGAVLIPGATAPRLIKTGQIARMATGSVFVDVAIDQGGCSETSRPTSHSDPVYREHGVIHYCVTNLPSAAARTATQALTLASLPFVEQLGQLGLDAALARDPHLRNGLNIYRGRVTHRAVAESLGYDYQPL